MFRHSCHIDDMTIIGQRPNPLDESWNAWTLVVCMKCKKLYEWQHHSEEQMHGGDLEVTALPTSDYLRHKYQIAEADVETILRGDKKVRRYDRYKKVFVEDSA